MTNERFAPRLAQVPQTLAPSTLFKDGQQMTSEAFFEEMNVREYRTGRSPRSVSALL